METTQQKQTPSAKEGKAAFKPPKKKRKWVKPLIVIVVIVAVVLFLFSSCIKGTKTLAGMSYIPETATRREMTVAVSGTGTIKPIDSYRVTALVRGEILEAPFQEGDTVHKDDMLFRVDAKSVENGIQQQESAIRQQEIALQQARVNLDSLLKNQSDAQKNQRVEANAAGVVTEVYVDEGDMVAAGSPIADILNRDQMKLTLPFHSADASSFSVGQSAAVTVDGTAGTLTGSIDSIAAADSVGPGGTLVRNVTILLQNPGVLTDASTGTASVGPVSCAGGGTFEYAARKQVVAKTSGELKSLTVREGDRVYEGQLLGSFDATDMDNQIENARLSIQSAELAIHNAELSLQSARDSLDDYTITSPIDGTIIEMNYKTGDNVDPSSAASTGISYMAVIYDMSALEFTMNIDELDINKVQVGQTVEITADALDGKTFTGRVDTININGTTQGGVTTYPVTIMVDNPEELLPGMNVSAKIVVERAGDVLSIPVEAVSRGNMVTVADPGAMSEDGLTVADVTKLREVEITLGRNDGAFIEVLEGLSEGDTVVYTVQASNAMMMFG